MAAAAEATGARTAGESGALAGRPRLRRTAIGLCFLALGAAAFVFLRMARPRPEEILSVLVTGAGGPAVDLSAEAAAAGFRLQPLDRAEEGPVRFLEVLEPWRLLLQTACGPEVVQLLGVEGLHPALPAAVRDHLRRAGPAALARFLDGARLRILPPEGRAGQALDLRNARGERLVWLEREGFFGATDPLGPWLVGRGLAVPVGSTLPPGARLLLEPGRALAPALEPGAPGLFSLPGAFAAAERAALLVLEPPPDGAALEERLAARAAELEADLPGILAGRPELRPGRGGRPLHAARSAAAWDGNPAAGPAAERILAAHRGLSVAGGGEVLLLDLPAGATGDDLDLLLAHALVHVWQEQERPAWGESGGRDEATGLPRVLPLLEAHAEAAAARAWRRRHGREGFSGLALSPWAFYLERYAAERELGLEAAVEELLAAPGAFFELALGRQDLDLFLFEAGLGPLRPLHLEARIEEAGEPFLVLRVSWAGEGPERLVLTGNYRFPSAADPAGWRLEAPPVQLTLLPGAAVDLILARGVGGEAGPLSGVRAGLSRVPLLPEARAAAPGLQELQARTLAWLHR